MLDLSAASPGLRVQHELMVRGREDKTTKNGSGFHDAVEDPELFPGDEELSVRNSPRLDRRVWRRSHAWD